MKTKLTEFLKMSVPTICFLAGLLVGLCTALGSASAQDNRRLQILFLGDQGHHRPADLAARIVPVLKGRGIDIQYTEDMNMLDGQKLKPFDGLLVYANIDSISPTQETALLGFVANGKGFIPLHCATYCFRNSDRYVELCGGQFLKHGLEEFSTRNVQPQHEIMKGFGGFRSWDETYVHHKHNTKDRVVLEVRAQGMQADGQTEEPWTWVRTHGQGRVFYTAWGHDARTWDHKGFQNLLERGIRWACKLNPMDAGMYQDMSSFPVPKMTELRKDLAPSTYTDVGAKIPNYTRGARWGTQAQPLTTMQNPLPPEESIKHFSTPVGFHMDLWASEPQFAGKPIAMTWDERGRLWVCETVDYPNELQPPTGGRDRIRICEDSNGDGKADKFTVFAEKLSIPTTLVCFRGGVLVQDGVETVYLKDIDGDDKADFRQVLITGWAMNDTHGGVSNFQYGLDNWIWAMQGYNNSRPVINGQRQQGFRQGFWRFKVQPGQADANAPATWIGTGSDANSAQRMNEHTVRVEQLEFLRATDNNTWGLGISEEGLIFGSTANNNPSNFMPIANRYYERVRGWAPDTLRMISNNSRFTALSDKVRQVDWHNAYTAGAGHALYTARRYPQAWWNRVAFVCEPTGKLVGTFILERDGAGYRSSSPFNLVASDDEWSAPIMAEVGPDGNMWIIDWYNYVVQHNPVPQGFRNGRGNAYESDLRDKKHGRVYRLVYDAPTASPAIPEDQTVAKGLPNASSLELVSVLGHPTMLWRKTAQRLLIQRSATEPSVVSALLSLVKSNDVDEIGLNAGAVHSLWTLDGLGLIQAGSADVLSAVRGALDHPSAAVRRAAIQILPESTENTRTLLTSGALSDSDAQVRLAAFLKLADLASENSEIAAALSNPGTLAAVGSDRWLLDAWTSAASVHSATALPALLANESRATLSEGLVERLPIVSEHIARSRLSSNDLIRILRAMEKAPAAVSAPILSGLSRGWPADYSVTLDDAAQASVGRILDQVPLTTKSQMINLTELWGIKSLKEQVVKITSDLFTVVTNANALPEARIEAAQQIVAMQPQNGEFVTKLVGAINPQTPPAVSKGFIQALTSSRAANVAKTLIDRSGSLTPEERSTAIRVLLARQETTLDLLESISSGTLQLSDIPLDQQQALSVHPNQPVRARANAILAAGGGLPNPDRQLVLDAWMDITKQTGDGVRGKEVYKKHCAACHRHGTDGLAIGPDLTGMAVHPKAELLMNVIDPSRSVEANFRIYNVLTVNGLVLNGMLAGESRTSVELIDSLGKRSNLLREDIEQLTASRKSLMPEGFEKQITRQEMTDLMEFLTTKGRFLPLPLASAATAISTKPMFGTVDDGPDRLIFADWSPKMVDDVPFALIDPQNGRVPNAILMNGPRGSLPPKMPKSVRVVCNAPASAIHILGGISGYGYPFIPTKSVCLTVRLHYVDGTIEDHELRNGEHFADYIRREEVPGSKFAFNLQGKQMRYLKISPKRQEPIKEIELVKGTDETAPIVMAMTLESPGQH